MGSLGFWAVAQQSPDWVAVVEADGQEHRAGRRLARVNKITHGLRALGLKPGDGIASVLPNGAAAVEVYLAALQAGWYLTPVNWHFTAPEIAYILRDCESKALFVHERFAAVGTAAADEAGGEPGDQGAEADRLGQRERGQVLLAVAQVGEARPGRHQVAQHRLARPARPGGRAVRLRRRAGLHAGRRLARGPAGHRAAGPPRGHHHALHLRDHRPAQGRAARPVRS